MEVKLRYCSYVRQEYYPKLLLSIKKDYSKLSKMLYILVKKKKKIQILIF